MQAIAAASKRYRVGIVGYGWVASAHIPAINATTRGQVTAVCSSRNLDEAELKARHGAAVTVYHDLDAMLADPAIDVVSLCSFPDRHADQAMRAARAGKHLIIEKPLCLTLEDLRRMRQAIRDAGIQTCVCFECRFSSQFLAIRSVIDRGLLGSLHYAEVDYYHGIGPWYGQYRWAASTAQGGSSLLSAGCHALDALLLCMGQEVTEVMSYRSQSQSACFAAYEFPGTSVSILKFQGGQAGKCVSCVDCLQPYYFHTHLVGSKGSLLDNKFHSADLGLEKSGWSTLAVKMLDSGDVSDHPYQTQFEAFFEALDRGAPMPLTDLDTAVKSHEVLFAADRSALLGRPVQLAEVR